MTRQNQADARTIDMLMRLARLKRDGIVGRFTYSDIASHHVSVHLAASNPGHERRVRHELARFGIGLSVATTRTA